MLCLQIQHPKTDGWWLVDGRGRINCLFLWIILNYNLWIPIFGELLSNPNFWANPHFWLANSKSKLSKWFCSFFPQLGVVSKFRSIQWFQVSFSLCSHSHVLVAWLPRFDTRYLPKFHHSNAEKIRGFGRSNPFLATEKSPFFVGLIHLESDTVNDD